MSSKGDGFCVVQCRHAVEATLIHVDAGLGGATLPTAWGPVKVDSIFDLHRYPQSH